jgi:hypothetical protein
VCAVRSCSVFLAEQSTLSRAVYIAAGGALYVQPAGLAVNINVHTLNNDGVFNVSGLGGSAQLDVAAMCVPLPPHVRV